MGQDGRRVGSPSHLSPPTYLDNFQIILKTYEFSQRFKERTAGMPQWEEFALLASTTCFYFLFFYFYFFMIVTERERERERESETQAEGEACSMQGARCGTWSLDSRIMPWAEGRRQTAAPPRDPRQILFYLQDYVLWFPVLQKLN